MLKQNNLTSKPPCKNGSFIYIYKLLTLKKKEYLYNVLRKRKYFEKGQHTGYNEQSLKQ